MLNDVLLEGTVLSAPELVREGLVKLTIDSTSDDNKLYMVVNCRDSLGKRVIKNIEKGMLVRIVGSLIQLMWKSKSGEPRNTYELEANHIEYRKMKTVVLK